MLQTPGQMGLQLACLKETVPSLDPLRVLSSLLELAGCVKLVQDEIVLRKQHHPFPHLRPGSVHTSRLLSRAACKPSVDPALSLPPVTDTFFPPHGLSLAAPPTFSLPVLMMYLIALDTRSFRF